MTDKEFASRLAAQAELKESRQVQGFEINAPARAEDLIQGTGSEVGTWAVKPSTKDEMDSFTRRYPGKVCLCRNIDEIRSVLEDPEFAGRRFQVQNWVDGETVSWAGSFDNGRFLSGLEIRPTIKAPGESAGGTTVLAIADAPRQFVESAAREMGEALRLDGLFEIEFQVDAESKVWFFGEINPRPWLQIPMILGRDPDPLKDYLLSQGVDAGKPAQRGRRYPVRWGSALRYIELNRRLRIIDLVRILTCEIRLSRWYTWKERASFLRRGLAPALARRWRDVRWT